MTRLKPIPVTVGAVAPAVRYSTPEQPVPALGEMDAEELECFEAVLRRWKSEGVRIRWSDLQRAARLARLHARVDR